MGVEAVTGAVIHTAWNLPPTRLARFLVATVVPGAYARDVLLRDEQARRRYDENTLQVLASVVLWQRHSEKPTCLREAESVLRAYCQQSGATLNNVLDPHAAAVAELLLRGNAERPESAPDATADAARGRVGMAATRDPGLRRQAFTERRPAAVARARRRLGRPADPTGRLRPHA